MESVQLGFIFHCIQGLKSGNSVKKIEEEYLKKRNITTDEFNRELNNCSKVRGKELSYELRVLIERGKNGFPIGKSLERLATKYRDSLLRDSKRRVQQAPFWAFIPLFCFFFPALALIFLGPLFKEFFKIV